MKKKKLGEAIIINDDIIEVIVLETGGNR